MAQTIILKNSQKTTPPNLNTGEVAITTLTDQERLWVKNSNDQIINIAITKEERNKIDIAYNNNHIHGNKIILDTISQKDRNVLDRLDIINNKLQISGDTYTTGELSAYGAGSGTGGSGGGGGGLIATVYDSTDFGGTFNNANYNDTFNAYSVNEIYKKGYSNANRILNLESGVYNKTETDARIAAVVNSAPSTLDTLNELANALGNDPNFATTTANLIGTKLSLSGGQLTGQLGLLQGAGGGISFPDNSFGGGGDSASIKLLNPAGGESTEMTFTMTNDADDIINFSVPSIDGVKINRYTVWNAGNFTNLNQLTTRNFNDLQNKPTTLGGYGITDSLLASAYTASDVLNKIKTVDGSGSGLDADTLDGMHLKSIIGFDTKRDFINGTLITTDIDYSGTNGDPFYLEIKGNAFTRGYPCLTQAQGYIYNNTIVNYGVTHLGYVGIFGLVALNVNGRLCFWFPRQAYWEGYSIFVSSAYNTSYNRVIAIDDVAKPAGTKEVIISEHTSTNAFLDSNVASATKLQTARTIAGVSFDGTDNISIPFANLSSIPTTLSGYGITDAYTKTQTDGFLALKLDVATFSDLFEKVNIGTELLPVYAIKAKYNFYSVGEVSAFGAGAGSGGSGLIQTVYDYSGLGGTYNNATLTDTFNAYTVNKINTDLGTRITSLESGSALTFTTVGSGNAVTSVTKSGTSVTVTKGLTFSVDGHTHSYLPLLGGQLTGQLGLLQGAGGGIIFPNDSFGGGGDSASIKLLNPAGGESTEMTFTMTNDADDIINFSVPSIDGVKINRYTVWNAGNDGAGSGLDADLLDGTHLKSIIGFNTKRDFINGTLITTDIDYSGTNGDPFYLEIKGNVYGRLYSCLTQAQGYIYADTIVNYGVTHLGYVGIVGLVALNINGRLCFWFPRQSYWEGYSIFVSSAYGTSYNRVITIDDVAKPAGTKEVIISEHTSTSAFLDSNVASATKLQTTRTIWGQNFDGTGNVSGNLEMGGYTISGTAGKIFFGGNFHIDSNGTNDLFLNHYNSTNIYMNYGATQGNTVIGGNVGIGQIDPTYKLSVAGSLRTTGTVYTNVGVKSRNICIETDNDGNASTASSEINNFNSTLFLQQATSNGLAMCAGGGNVSIGTTYNGGYRLYVNGTSAFSSATTFYDDINAQNTINAYKNTPNGTTYSELGIQVYSNDGSPVGIGFHRAGYTQAILEHNGDGLTIRNSGTIGTGQLGNLYANTVTAPTFVGNLNGNASTATRIEGSVSGANTIELVRATMADNDLFRILVGGTASNAGYVEIATADDGSEPIYVRQYSGVFTSLVRTATLLDEAGNTSFPGTVTGSRFYTGYDSGRSNSISCSNWFYSNGATGWWNETYQGGIYMADTTYVRVHSKAFKVSNTASDSINTDGGVLANGEIRSNSNITAGGELTAYVASDRKLKKNIKPIDNALNIINKLEAVSYNWNSKAKKLNDNKTDQKDFGLIAQDVEVILPEIVHNIHNEEYKAIDYIKLIPFLIKSIQEQQKQIEELKEQLQNN